VPYTVLSLDFWLWLQDEQWDILLAALMGMAAALSLLYHTGSLFLL